MTVLPKPDPSKTMLATAWYGTEDVRVVRVPAPDITDPADCVVRVTSCTICGSDLHMFFNKLPVQQGVGMRKGDILGHEAMGVIDKVGPEVRDRRVGDRVVVSAPIACGQCGYCKQEQYSLCDVTNPSETTDVLYGHRLGGQRLSKTDQQPRSSRSSASALLSFAAVTALFGYSHLTGGYPGSQAEYVRVSRSPRPLSLPFAAVRSGC